MNDDRFRRFRRLREQPALRALTSETRLHPADFIYPLFVSDLASKPEPIDSMPGIRNFPVDLVADEAGRAFELGIPAVLLFGVPETRDARGDVSVQVDGIVQRAIQRIKSAVPGLAVITDVCLCEYTTHGHCGILDDTTVDNDATIHQLARQALSHAQAGADMVAPSDMMDGRVQSIRQALDANNYLDLPILSYAAKFCSAFYGPFREAVGSAPQFGDRSGYQMDAANRREALQEIQTDIAEGADILMIKPALAYLDVISEARRATDYPLAAYNVSGEYAAVKQLAASGVGDEKRLVLEILTSIKRAGADMIVTYHACDAASWLKG